MRIAKLIVIFSFITFLISCTSEHSKIVVAEYGDKKIYMDEFEKEYAKNSGGAERAKKDSVESYKKFLDLFVNYKMKLRDAEVRGYTKDEDMQKEYDDYKANIGTTLFLEKELYEPNLKALFEKRKYEYRVSHIYLTEDSVMNKQKVEELGRQLLDRVNKGEDFGKLAKEYSKDEVTKKSGGDVYYVTAGRIGNPVLEDAVYTLDKGQIYPKLVWSGYGYHIIKATDKKLRRGSIAVSHIMIQFADSLGHPDTTAALKRIQEIEKKLKQGADFANLAKKYSSDKMSGDKGGDVGFIDHNMMPLEFDEAAFMLKVGEVSPIVKTKFGFHLIKVTGEKPLPAYEEDKENLREMFKNTRYKQEYAKLIDRLMNETSFTVNGATKTKILANADSVRIGIGYAETKVKKNAGSDVLFSMNGKNYIVDSLFNYATVKSILIGQNLDNSTLDNLIKQYAGDKLVKEKAMIYDQVDTEFATLMKEYKNGMYLFKILEEEVWTKINIDTTAVKNYWDKNKEKFQWGNRVEFKEIHVTTDSLVNVVNSASTSGANFDTLYTKYNQRYGDQNKPGYYGLVDVEYNQLAREANKLQKPGEISKPFKFENGWSIVKLLRKDNAKLKLYDEAKAEAASMLQDSESKRLEEGYLNKLKNLYKPKYNYEELSNAYKQ